MARRREAASRGEESGIMSTSGTDLGALREKAQRLLRTLEDPQPELATWREVVTNICGEIIEYARPGASTLEKLYARNYAHVAMSQSPPMALDLDWESVREEAREMIANSTLRGRELLDALGTLDDHMERNGHYEPGGDDDD